MTGWFAQLGESLHPWQARSLLWAQLLGPLIWLYQNARPDRLGGRISFIKALWLAYVIVLWLLAPCLLAGEHPAYPILAASMVLRVLIEIPLCLKQRWKVGYGMAHNLLQLLLASLVAAMAAGRGEHLLLAVSLLIALSALTEMLFVRWFRVATAGPGAGVYFVPGGACFARVNRLTACLFLPQCAAFLALLISNLPSS